MYFNIFLAVVILAQIVLVTAVFLPSYLGLVLNLILFFVSVKVLVKVFT